jgi:hypothetical protein
MKSATLVLVSLILLAPTASRAVPDPNPGGVVNVLTYFPMTGAGCMSPTSTAEWRSVRNAAATSAQQCAGTGPMFFVYKGAPRWSTESFFVESGWLKNYEEAFYNPSINNVRVFRDHATGRKGLLWMPTSWSTSSSPSWNDVPTDIDQYQNNGQCYGVPLSSHGPADIGYGSAYTVLLPGWLSDGRTTGKTNPPAFSPNRDVYAVVKSGTYFGGDGTRFTENYYYGKFYSEADARWYGLGLVIFESFVNNVRTDRTENHYLVNCSVGDICNSCPDL